MTVQEIYNLSVEALQDIFPGPYFIYKVDNYNNKYGFHIGCTRNMKTRKTGHLHNSTSLPVVLFETMSLYQADEKEREIKREHGMNVIYESYINDLKRQLVASSKEVRKKALANTDMQAKYSEYVRERCRQAKEDKMVAVNAYTVKVKSRRADLSTKVFYKHYRSLVEASKDLNMTPSDIAHILSPKFAAKSRKGYTFELA